MYFKSWNCACLFVRLFRADVGIKRVTALRGGSVFKDSGSPAHPHLEWATGIVLL